MKQRLRGWGGNLSRQAGGRVAGGAGIGGRGPGETKIETDRRRINTKIAKLRRELKRDEGHPRHQAARAARRNEIPTVAIAGYTNAGKSSLLNRLTGAGVLVEDSLFATLDPTTRRTTTADGRVYTMSDTVGFVRHLPHQLVEAFRSTLEEVADADLILHVVDGSHPDPEGQLGAVREVLAEIDATEGPRARGHQQGRRRRPAWSWPGCASASRTRWSCRRQDRRGHRRGARRRRERAAAPGGRVRGAAALRAAATWSTGCTSRARSTRSSTPPTARWCAVAPTRTLAGELAAYAVEPAGRSPARSSRRWPARYDPRQAGRDLPGRLRGASGARDEVVLASARGAAPARPRGGVAALLVALGVSSWCWPDRATGSYAARCQRFGADSAARAARSAAAGDPVLVIGDSWTAGLGLADRPPRGRRGWRTRAGGGLPGSGFSAGGLAVRRGLVRRPRTAALAGLPADALVVVEGGLNDVDRSAAEINAGFEDLLDALADAPCGRRRTARAPARAGVVPRVDALLARLAARHDVAYVSTARRAPRLPRRRAAPHAGRAPRLRRGGRGGSAGTVPDLRHVPCACRGAGPQGLP